MIKRMKTGVAALAALAALGFGGSAIAGAAQGNAPQPQGNAQPSAPQQSKAPEKRGQESTAPESSATDPDDVQSTTAPDAAGSAEQPGNEKAEIPGTESGSEVPGDDGPGGHADEPGNPNAGHQAQGVE